MESTVVTATVITAGDLLAIISTLIAFLVLLMVILKMTNSNAKEKGIQKQTNEHVSDSIKACKLEMNEHKKDDTIERKENAFAIRELQGQVNAVEKGQISQGKDIKYLIRMFEGKGGN